VATLAVPEDEVKQHLGLSDSVTEAVKHQILG